MEKKHKLVDDVTREKSEEIIKQAKKKGYQISEQLASKGSILGSKLKKKTNNKKKEQYFGTNSRKNVDIKYKFISTLKMEFN